MPGIPVAFDFPFVLAALAGLPLLYLLLRITPPRPRIVPFPPLRLILGLQPREETALRMPWWLLLLRLAVAACVILAMAGPVLNPRAGASATGGALLIVIDDGWPAAPSWERRIAAATRKIEAAGHIGQPAAIVPISDGAREIVLSDPAAAIARLRALTPVPFTPDRLAVAGSLEKFAAAHRKPEIVWIADGLDRGQAAEFANKLAGFSSRVTLMTDEESVRALAAAENQPGQLAVRVLRDTRPAPDSGRVRALDRKGREIGQAAFGFTGATAATAKFELPVELRNEIFRLEIAGERSAGAVFLLDERSRRRRIGIVSGETADVAQPLLAPDYYLTKAISPFADVREAKSSAAKPVQSLLDEHVAALILADVGLVPGQAHDALGNFVESGGVLIRFAGERLAGTPEDLVPVRLRRGGRVLGGAMSWDTPKKLGAFDRQSPFFGLAVPDEVTVSRQVLAEPGPGLAAKTWARLSDGTPLVTASQRGEGLIVLFHVTADTTWSNLPLSGLFVSMLERIVALSRDSGRETGAPAGAKNDLGQALAPNRILDGFGVLGAPPPGATAIPAGFDGPAGPEHPPGYYGPQEGVIAVNALGPDDKLAAVDYANLGFARENLREQGAVDLKPWLIALAFILFAVDTLTSLLIAGNLRLGRARAARLVVLVLGAALVLAPGGLRAEPASQPSRARDLGAALTTRLAYVRSGDPRVDEVARQGLAGLSRVLARRTSLIPGDPVALDPAQDELSFYPLLYWPVVASQLQPPGAAIQKAALFMKQGGTIIFDTRDAPAARPGGPPTPEARWLRALLEGADIPPLEPVPADHVVTKTFYLIEGFPGRYANGTTWIEALPPAPADGTPRPARAGDSVSPIIITSNDLAAGWASDSDGESLYPLEPGGERQHELALRGGVNL
ncbi:MAG: DUF4159 domain-containing protein, partial [Methylocapsa sp.]|nr:DUF4159 domain-containing protein [Methylocapsa sp.]